MKQFITWFILFFPYVLFAQVVIEQSDMPGAGDTIRLSHTVNFGQIEPEETGEGYTWDFSSLFPVYQTVDTFVSVNQTPFAYQIFFFLTSNLAMKQMSFDQFPGFQVTDSYRFFKNSSASYKEVGFGVTINGFPLPTLFQDPDVIYQFPVQVGSVDSSNSSYGFDIPALGYFGGWKKRKNTVDGWGTLITPYGSFETIRLKSEVVSFDSIYLDSLGFGIPMYSESIEYKWLGKQMGLPLFEVIDNGLVQSVNYIDSVRTIITGNVVDTKVPSFQLYPNPARDRITVQFEGEPGQSADLDLFQADGRLVVSGLSVSSGHPSVLDLTPYELQAGTYILVFHLGSGKYSRKLFVY